jgi:hypothetical protein
MAALMPIMIAATLLTSGVRRIHDKAHLGAAGKVASLRQRDVREDVAALDLRLDRNSAKPD